MSVIFVLLALSSFRNIKKTELDFNQKKAILIKENLDLKDSVDSLQETIKQKTAALGAVEKEKAALEEQVNALKTAAASFRETSDKELVALKQRTLLLNKKIYTLKKTPIAQRIRSAIDKEENEKIKKVLEDSANKIDMIREGKSVDLEPIIVTKKGSETPSSAKEKSTVSQKKEVRSGVVLSVDKKNNLIVINLGRNDGVKEGYVCQILKDGQVIGAAEIMSVRYRVSAAYVKGTQYKVSMDDIKEGCRVTAPEEQ
jgi:hypothetical protein